MGAGAATQQPPTPYIIGDSIGQGISQASGYTGTTQIGASPQWVLNQIKKNSDDLKARDIYLSTGVINNPAQANLIQEQLDALKQAGAGHVTILGVGNQNAEINANLNNAAQRNGYTFAGGFETGPDNIHPKDYGGYYKTFGGQAPAPAPPGPQLPTNVLSLQGFQSGIQRAEGWHPGQAPSSAGAQGPWQVIPSTARDPGYGITPASDPSNFNELNRVGEQYSAAMFNKYGPTLGAAAYNWGPGQVDKLISQYGDPRKGQISMEDFVSKMPVGVQHYINTVAGGKMALPGQVPTGHATIAATQTAPANPLSLPAPPAPPDMKPMWTMMALQSLLPKGMGFQRVDYDPRKAYEVGHTPPPRVDWGGFRTPHITLGEGGQPTVTAISPSRVPQQRGHRTTTGE